MFHVMIVLKQAQNVCLATSTMSLLDQDLLALFVPQVTSLLKETLHVLSVINLATLVMEFLLTV